MALRFSFSLILLSLVNFLFSSKICADEIEPSKISIPFNRTSFPSNFLFGATSSAYQYEGAAFEDGKGPSIWDVFAHKHPEKIVDHSNGDVADDFYHRYKEDVQLMKFEGLNGFKFSISWPRVLPHGKLSKGVNKPGVAFYNNLINELIENGITPIVTLFHWDTPQALEDDYLGFLNISVVDDFRDFAELCFKEFGDRVKYWATFNEPLYFAGGGYDSSTLLGQTTAPGRCSAWMNKCETGDSSTEPYLVGHNILLSHATVAKLYREKYKPSQKGQIGIVLVTSWMKPYSKSKADAAAVQRALDFFLGWFLDPLTYGDYPKSMRTFVGKRLPKFTPKQSALVKGSLDFLALNYYTTNYVSDLPFAHTPDISYTSDVHVNISFERNGKLIGAPTFVYIKEKYKNPSVYITENGYAEINIDTVMEGIHDTNRVKFYRDHFKALKKAIDLGVDAKGFFAWTFLDTFEWDSGFTIRLGINFVDYKNKLKRYPKLSGIVGSIGTQGHWFGTFQPAGLGRV
ncbi:hypothetical protein ACH5RR_000683, partial [Cinchona calisaya]